MTTTKGTRTMTGTTRTTDLLAAALVAAERGWPVFPVRPNAKRPAFPDHTEDRCTRRDPRCRAGHQGWEPRATTDPDRIRRAWSLAPFNVGIATGPAALVVLDLDTRKPDDDPPQEWRMDGVGTGEDVLALLCERAGQPVPYDTHMVRTGRGGRHLYFTPPPGLRLANTAKRLGWLIDTRAHGGYVLAAGSVVAHRPYTALNDSPPAPLPPWLADALTPARAEPSAPTPALQELLARAQRCGGYVGAALRGEADRVTSAGTGRNHALNVAAFRLGQLVGAGLLAREDAEATLTAAAVEAGLGRDPRQVGEIPRTIASGLNAGIRNPRRVSA